MLNPQSPLPLYHQLADRLAAMIRSGEYGDGARIPSENQLAAAYGIGRPTVRQGIDVLVRRKMLVRRRGSGTYVHHEKACEIDLFSLAGTTSAFQRQGIAAPSRILKRMARRQVAASADNPFAGARAYTYSRLSSVEDTPVLIEDLYLDPALFDGIDAISLKGRSLAAVAAERYYLRPTGGKQHFRIDYLKGVRARHLDLAPDQPVLVVNRWLHFPNVENAIYADLYCRTDRFVFSQIIGGLGDE
ncbi:MAG: GntR family transcriptional regulator [Desulfosarcina sp.]|nr:GntR family transcriptional regulator [Desulfobacterales bacterium]